MKKTKLFQVAAFLLSFAILNSCTKTDITPPSSSINQIEKIREGDAMLSANDANGNTIVSGGGKFVRLGMFGEPLGPDVQFSIHAIQKKDGSVKGKLVYHSQQVDVQGEINCLSIFVSPIPTVGVIARVSGVMTKVEPSDDYYFAGARFGFSVYDRGEGSSSLPDQVLDISNILGEEDCTNFFIPGVRPYPLTSGNIQIKLASE